MPLALVIGAGVGGLAAGLALRRAGWEIRIFERDPAPRAVGFALGLAPNGMAALRDLGIAEPIRAQGFTPVSAEIRRVDGRILRRLGGRREDLPDGDIPTMVLRSVLHQALLDALGSGAVEAGRAAVRVESEGARARVQFADGTTAAGDILVGADGVASVVRAQLHPDEGPARPSGYVGLRGLSPAVEQMNGVEARWYFGRGVESGFVQTSPSAIYWFLSLFTEDLKGGSVAAPDVVRRFTAGFDDQFHAVAGATPPGDMRLDELFEREPLAQWGAGRVTLLGDAAHPMLPFTGQGAAQALEDAVALGRVMKDAPDHVAALRRYEDVRGRRTRKIVRLGPRIARITTTRNPVVGAVRNAAIRLVPQGALIRGFTRTGPDPHRDLLRPLRRM